MNVSRNLLSLAMSKTRRIYCCLHGIHNWVTITEYIYYNLLSIAKRREFYCTIVEYAAKPLYLPFAKNELTEEISFFIHQFTLTK